MKPFSNRDRKSPSISPGKNRVGNQATHGRTLDGLYRLVGSDQVVRRQRPYKVLKLNREERHTVYDRARNGIAVLEPQHWKASTARRLWIVELKPLSFSQSGYGGGRIGPFKTGHNEGRVEAS